jgi:uncharacterized RDD family membrane protein YckC/Tfp pilus assembly major pilin PilA
MYAGFWKRFAAASLDLMILLVPMLVIGIIVALITGPKSTATAAADLSTLAVLWLYFAIMESSSRQATLGKIAFGIRVVDLDGNRISFLRASARFFAKLLSGLSLAVGFLMAAVTRRKQALHDIVASCLVVNADATAADVLRAGPAPARSARGIVAIVLAVVCLPLAAAGAAVAIPAYQDYTVRAKVNDAVQSGRGATTGVAAYMVRHKAPPRSLEDARAVPSSPYLREAVITREGAIVLTLAVARLEGKRITFVPTAQSPDKIVWTCMSEDIAQRLLPRQCRR